MMYLMGLMTINVPLWHFLILSAAFGTSDINKLLVDLSDEVGLCGKALDWCSSFLTNHTQQVKINGKYSNSHAVKYGAPQGSVLRPII